MLTNMTLRRFQTMSPPLFWTFTLSRKKFYGTPVSSYSFQLNKNGYSILVLHAIMSSIQYVFPKFTWLSFCSRGRGRNPRHNPAHTARPLSSQARPSLRQCHRHHPLHGNTLRCENPSSMYRIDYILWNISLNVPSLLLFSVP